MIASILAALDLMLAFEGADKANPRAGWTGGPAETLFLDEAVVHGGKASGRIERTAASPSRFSTFSATLPIDFAGKTIELRGFLKTEGVAESCGLWLREDGDSAQALAFDNMATRGLRGTTDWTEYSIKLPLEEEGVKLYFGALLAGEGKIWVDDLQLFVDGVPIEKASKITRPKTPLDTDHEFDAGSKVTIDAVTPRQVESLTMLGKVWGFLKYHHPKVVGGDVHWDYELFRVMPRVLATTDAATAQKAILEWAKRLGPVKACAPCATLPDSLALRADLDWIHDRATLGPGLSAYLEAVYKNRASTASQAYVSLAPGIGNPEFRREKGPPERVLPDTGTRLLALYRWWNVVQYWSPYRDVTGADWNAVLPEFIPRFVAVRDVDAYQREMLAVIARLSDGHANLWASLEARPPAGECRVAARLRSVEGRPVVVETYGEASLKAGDAVLAVDGVPVEKLFTAWKPYYSASNDVRRTQTMIEELTDGTCGTAALDVERSGARVAVNAARVPKNGLKIPRTNDRPGAAFQRLSEDVAYLKLSEVKVAEIPQYLEGAAGTKGWIIDIRNYPSEFVPFALGGHFVSESTPFVRFTVGDTSNPGAFRMSDPPLSIPPLAPRYDGKVVVLVDESSISQAEYTAMAFRAAGALVIGSTTAGADGNVSPVPLPGGLQSLISGIGVFYPDKRPTQRVGIVPDVEVKPTIAGIREGRDEVLERAIARITGAGSPE